MHLAYFVSPHGFGHAARAVAVMEALRLHRPGIRFELFTTVPRWVFSVLGNSVRYHHADVDLGLIQVDALNADLAATLTALDSRLPFRSSQIEELSRICIGAGCNGIVCDIAPVGIAVAENLQLTSFLIENFTWDWIYRGLDMKGFLNHANYLGAWYRRASFHIQTEPVCNPGRHALTVGPVSRTQRMTVRQVRCRLSVTASESMVFFSMGGVAQSYPFIGRLKRDWPAVRFIIAGSKEERVDENVRLLPVKSDLDHPGIVAASDLVIGKIGYSTLAEVYNAGVRFVGFSREDNPEMKPLENFARETMPAVIYNASEFESGLWLDRLGELLQLPVSGGPVIANGADKCAALILEGLAV